MRRKWRLDIQCHHEVADLLNGYCDVLVQPERKRTADLLTYSREHLQSSRLPMLPSPGGWKWWLRVSKWALTGLHATRVKGSGERQQLFLFTPPRSSLP